MGSWLHKLDIINGGLQYSNWLCSSILQIIVHSYLQSLLHHSTFNKSYVLTACYWHDYTFDNGHIYNWLIYLFLWICRHIFSNKSTAVQTITIWSVPHCLIVQMYTCAILAYLFLLMQFLWLQCLHKLLHHQYRRHRYPQLMVTQTILHVCT